MIMQPHMFWRGRRHYSQSTNGEHCIILIILQASVHVTSTFSLDWKKTYKGLDLRTKRNVEDNIAE